MLSLLIELVLVSRIISKGGNPYYINNNAYGFMLNFFTSIMYLCMYLLYYTFDLIVESIISYCVDEPVALPSTTVAVYSDAVVDILYHFYLLYFANIFLNISSKKQIFHPCLEGGKLFFDALLLFCYPSAFICIYLAYLHIANAYKACVVFNKKNSVSRYKIK